MKIKKFLLASFAIIILVVFCNRSIAQISYGGTPPSIKYNIVEDNLKKIDLPAPDVGKLLEEDEFTDKYGIPMRFAVSLQTDIDIPKAGVWTNLPDGGRICRLKIKSENAKALIVYYDKFLIPEGGKLFLYNKSKTQVIGAFTSLTNPKRSSFANEMILGDELTLEYYEPFGTLEKPCLYINEVGYAYRAVGYTLEESGFGGSGDCEVNVNCEEGANWQYQKKGIARIIVKTSSSQVWCTGSLINNVRSNGTPYFLTANHCGANATPYYLNQWIFYFRYEGPGCENPPNDTAFNSYTMVGTARVACSGGAGVGSDFSLMLLNELVPAEYEPYYNGWNIENSPSPYGVTIHHPQGDIKKISTYTEPLISTNWASIPNTHWLVVWDSTENGHGVTEGGSSGCPIFDNNKRIVGQLTGGEASCQNPTGPDYYGKLWYSWEQNSTADTTMLKPWLDPDSTGLTAINGTLVGIADLDLAKQVKIYPNPTNGLVYIYLGKQHKKDYKISVYNILGDEIIHVTGIDFEGELPFIDLTSFNTGVYLFRVEVGGEIYSAKVLR